MLREIDSVGMQCTRKSIAMKGFLCAVLFMQTMALHAQGVDVNGQTWFDYSVVYPFANIWTADAELSYQTLVSGGDKWRSYQFTPGIQRNMTPRIDLFLSTPLY